MGVLGIPVVFLAPERLWAIPGALLFFVIVGVFAIRKLSELKQSIFAREFVGKGDILPLSMKVSALVAMALAAVCLALAWAKPEAVAHVDVPRFGGVRIVYLSDVSLSMDAVDVSDGSRSLSRIAAEKYFLEMLEQALVSDADLQGNYSRTIVPFAGGVATYGGFTVSPVYMRELIAQLSTTGMIGKQGSDLPLAIESYRALIEDNPKDDATIDIGIVLSDGGNDPGGFTIDVGALNKSLASIRDKADIIAVGFGGDTAATIPTLKKEKGLNGELLKPTGEPWVTAFDEEMMVNLAGTPERCIRLLSPGERAMPPSVAARSTQCQRVFGVSSAVHEIKQRLLQQRTPLPSISEERRTPVGVWFGAFGFLFLLIGLSGERLYSVWRRHVAPGPMREVLFGETAE